MKNLILGIVIALGVMSFSFINPPAKAVFKVSGNCGMCKKRIEAAMDTKGIRSAEWDVDSKMIEVIYVPEKITLDQIHKLIAGVGHDTDKEKATDEVYKKLPDCCLYRENPNTHKE